MTIRTAHLPRLSVFIVWSPGWQSVSGATVRAEPTRLPTCAFPPCRRGQAHTARRSPTPDHPAIPPAQGYASRLPIIIA